MLIKPHLDDNLASRYNPRHEFVSREGNLEMLAYSNRKSIPPSSVRHGRGGGEHLLSVEKQYLSCMSSVSA